ncbi:MAG: hypothetical protein K2O01_01960 [Bacteroidales bacterium]|nr:hypothetical protein [Bacteroidales bacterium]
MVKQRENYEKTTIKAVFACAIIEQTESPCKVRAGRKLCVRFAEPQPGFMGNRDIKLCFNVRSAADYDEENLPFRRHLADGNQSFHERQVFFGGLQIEVPLHAHQQSGIDVQSRLKQ